MAEGNHLTTNCLQMEFANASSYVKTIVAKISNQQMLEFYGLYKQATEGPCRKSKPSWYEVTEKQKWEAWSLLKDMNSEEAMENYINLLNSIDPHWEEKPVENPTGWIHHSCMKNEDEEIEDSKKTIFDWVKEKNLNKVKTSSSGITSEINKLDERGLSLLHWATDRGSLEIVKYFVEHLKADVNVKDVDGQTPLHYAVSCQYDDIANYLTEAGADVNLKDNDGLTAYETVEKCL